MNRKLLADKILARMILNRNEIMEQWQSSAPIHHFVLDDVLPP